ncbi:MAG: hypothetical protein ABSF86_23925 [Steroidobacteraceae bacterium]
MIRPIDTSVAGVTVKPVEPEIVPTVAVIVTDPWPSAVASPLEPDALLIAARLGFEEAQVAAVVRFCVELSV